MAGDPYPTMNNLETETAPASSLADTLYPSMGLEAENQITAEPPDKPEAKPPDGQAKPEGEKAAGAPAEYADFKLPEGMALDAATATEFKAVAKDLGLSQEKAEKTLEHGAKLIQQRWMEIYKPFFERQVAWETEAKKDPGFEQNLKLARSVFVPGRNNPLVGSAKEAQALKEALNYTGAGSNPAFIRLFARAAQYIQARPIKDLTSRMYPEME